MKTKTIIIVLSIVALLALDLVLRPYLRQKNAHKVVSTVLTNWQDGDLTLAMSHWVREIDSPPVYGLIDYEVKNGTFGKKDGRHTARILATFYFSPDNPLPSGKDWIFELEKTRIGWKIKDCKFAQDRSRP